MARSKSGTALKRKPSKRELKHELTDQQRVFVAVYPTCFSEVKAAAEAKYKDPGQAGYRLIRHPLIQQAIAHEVERIIKKQGLKAEEMLFHLWCIATMSSDDFKDENGRVITNLNDLTFKGRNCIAGIEQEVTTRSYDDGSTEETVKTKLRLNNKNQALEMLMKHLGQFEADNKQANEGKLTIDLNSLYGRPDKATAPDVIEVKKLESDH